MAPSNVFLALLCGCSGVQGSNMDLASIVQTHMDSHAGAPWKTQAQTFIGLLQAMGKQVPQSKVAETTGLVNQIIDFLSNEAQNMTSTATQLVTAKQTEMTSNIVKVQEYDSTVVEKKTSVETQTQELETCYAGLRVTQTKYETDCNHAGSSLLQNDGTEDPASLHPSCTPACTEMENTKKQKFTVSSKFNWTCNFTAGNTAETCTNNHSPIKQDLVGNKNSMLAMYDAWKSVNETCNEEKKKCQKECSDLKTKLSDAKGDCSAKLSSISGLLCVFTSAVQTREEFMGLLQTSISEGRQMGASDWPAKTEYLDLQLIICIFKRFRDSPSGMNFAQSDYTECQAQIANNAFVTPPTIPNVPDTQSVEDLKVGGGLADKYLGLEDAFGIPMPVSPKMVTLAVHLRTSSTGQPALFLKLADEKDVPKQFCPPDVLKTPVVASDLAAAQRRCAETQACLSLEFSATDSFMGNHECIPQPTEGTPYTILRKVC